MTTAESQAGTCLHRSDQDGVWESGQVAFSPERGWLSIGSRRIELDHRSANLLLALAEAGGRAVSKDALMGRAWPGRLVHENSIAKAISKLRVQLAGSGLVIVTVHGVGYRLDSSGPEPAPQPELSPRAAPAARAKAGGIERGGPRRGRFRPVPLAGALVAAVGVFGLAALEWGRGGPLPVPVRTAPPLTNDPADPIATILWVDDNPDNNTLDVQYLRSRRVAVHLAPSSAEAEHLLAINRYDLIISDLGRGEDRLAGIKFADRARARGLAIPIMIYTMRPPDPARQRAQRDLVAASGATHLALTPQEVRAKALAVVRQSGG